MSWSSLPDMPTARRNLAATSDSNGNIYALGGIDGNGNQLPAFEKWDGSKWTSLPDMPVFKDRFDAATGPNDNIYALAGRDPSSIASAQAFVFDGSAWSQITDMTTGRPRLSASGAPGSSNKVVAMSGRFRGQQLVEVWTGSAWDTTILNDLPAQKQRASATITVNDEIYILGGQDGRTDKKTVLQNSGSGWSSIPNMSAFHVNGGAASDGQGNVFAVAGSGGGSSAQTITERWDGSTWTTQDPLPKARGEIACAADANGNIYALGGENTSGDTKASAFVFQTATGPSKPAAPSNLSLTEL
jgi:N-acetylneuraminic acid mutarotase